MAFSGLLALLDDISTVADDVATLTLSATKKTTGIVTDDMAVTAEQTLGLQRERELPVVWAVSVGSLRNKALILVPAALVLNAFAPWSITPLLMAGGAFLCFEGVEKILHKALPHDAEHDVHEDVPVDPVAYEKLRVGGAIRTDLILSAEIIAISLAEVAESDFWTQVAVLYAISVIMTVGVYGMVALLVKLDDAGQAMVDAGGGTAAVGRLVLLGVPWLMKAISWIGTIAMLLVGGHLILHGIAPLERQVHELLHHLPAFLEGYASIGVDFLVGGVVGLVVVGVMATGIPARLWSMMPWVGKA